MILLVAEQSLLICLNSSNLKKSHIEYLSSSAGLQIDVIYIQNLKFFEILKYIDNRQPKGLINLVLEVPLSLTK